MWRFGLNGLHGGDRPRRRLFPSDLHRDGAREAMGAAAIVCSLGMAFGVVAQTMGFGPGAAIAMSMITFSGAGQFSALGVAEAGGGIFAAAAAAGLVNSRYMVAALTLVPESGGPVVGRFLRGQLVVDLSWAVGQTTVGPRMDKVVGAGVVLYVAWTAGTIGGVVVGQFVPDPYLMGLDAAFPALFLALLRPHLLQKDGILVALIAAGSVLALTSVLPPGLPLLIAALAATLGLRKVCT